MMGNEITKTVFIVTAIDHDGYTLLMSAWTEPEKAESFVKDFKDTHRDDDHWKLDTLSIVVMMMDSQ